MLIVRTFSLTGRSTASMTALLFLALTPGLAQSPAATSTPAASQPAGADSSQPACPVISSKDIPFAATLQVKVKGILDAAHQKPGKNLWLSLGRGVVFPECTMQADSAVYGHVTAASASKNPPSSQLSLLFDHVDCDGKGKKEMKLWLVGIIAPPDTSRHLHNEVPTEVSGGSRRISDAAANLDGYDAELNPGGPPNTVKPGAVVGFKDLKLEPTGGPSCSARLTSPNKNIELGMGTTLLFAVPGN